MTPEEIETAVEDTCEMLFPHFAYQGDFGLYYWPARLIVDGDYTLGDAGEKRAWLVSEALAGVHCAHEALCRVARELTANDEPLPLWLQKYIVRAAKEGKAPASRGQRENMRRKEGIGNYSPLVRC